MCSGKESSFRYSGVTWAWWRPKLPTLRPFVQHFIQTNKKEHIKTPQYWPCVSDIYWWPIVNMPVKPKEFTCPGIMIFPPQTMLSFCQLLLYSLFLQTWPWHFLLTLAMACCLTAPSHYLNQSWQSWLAINGLFLHSTESNYTGDSQEIYPWHELWKLPNHDCNHTPQAPVS